MQLAAFLQIPDFMPGYWNFDNHAKSLKCPQTLTRVVLGFLF